MKVFGPDIVLTHWTSDPVNPDHEAMAAAAMQACQYAYIPGVMPELTPLARRPQVFFFEPSVPYTPLANFQPDVYIDVTDVFEKKLEALHALATQDWITQYYTFYGELRGFQARELAGLKDCRYAEGYCRFFPAGGQYLD